MSAHDFRLHLLRFSMVAREPIRFPAGNAANLLRGGFGAALRVLVCSPECPGARHCTERQRCLYARLFEPSAAGHGPSGLADSPRPFVFRTSHLDGRTLCPGDRFHFDMNLFDVRGPAPESLDRAFAALASAGLGPGRGRAELTGMSSSELKVLSLEPAAFPVTHVRVHFLTPTELKSGRKLADRPEFGVLAARIRDRLSALRQLYDRGPLPIDFAAFGERATRVRMTRCSITHADVKRRSRRTGQTHPLGGFVGEAEYEGDLAEFVPYLEAARWTGVGRQTVWGKGEIRVLETR